MPLLWRYLTKHFVSAFFLCLCSFVALLLISRSQDIAKFAATSDSWKLVGLFALYQVPHILPLAIPISALIATMILFHTLSSSYELTSMRASGISLKLLTAPIFLLTGLFALTNLYMVSEIAPKCRILSKKVLFQTASNNPLVLMQKDKLLKIKDTFADMEMIRTPHLAGNVLFAFRNPSTERINLITAKKLEMREDRFHGHEVAFVSTVDGKANGLDHLIIENQREAIAETSLISDLLQTSSFDFGAEFFPLKQMLIRGKIEKAAIASELTRRLFFLVIPFTLVFIGLAYSIQVGRRSERKLLFQAILLAVFTFACYFAAKSFETKPPMAIVFFLLPHPLVFAIAGRRIAKTVRGIA